MFQKSNRMRFIFYKYHFQCSEKDTQQRRRMETKLVRSYKKTGSKGEEWS